MSKKKLTDAAQTFDEWLAAYIVENHLENMSISGHDILCTTAHAAFIQGYIRGTHATMEVLKK